MNLKHAKWVTALALAVLSWFSGLSQTAAPALSPAASDVVKLVQSGTTDQVILGYIQNSPSPYNLTADSVLYLKDLGVSSQVLTAMLNHDKAASGQNYIYNQQLYPPNGSTPPPPGPDQPVGPPPGDVPPPEPVPVAAPAPAPTGSEHRCPAGGELFLQRPFTLRLVGGFGRLRLVLATDRYRPQSRLAALLRRGTLGLYRLGMVMGFGLFLGLGAVSLLTMGHASALRLGMVSRHGLGACLGRLAQLRR